MGGCVGIDVGNGTDMGWRGAEERDLETAIAGCDWSVNQVGLEERVVDEGDRVGGDVCSVVVFVAGLCKAVVVGVSGIGDSGAWFLKAEDVDGVVDGIVKNRDVVIGFRNVVGAEAEGVKGSREGRGRRCSGTSSVCAVTDVGVAGFALLGGRAAVSRLPPEVLDAKLPAAHHLFARQLARLRGVSRKALV